MLLGQLKKIGLQKKKKKKKEQKIVTSKRESFEFPMNVIAFHRSIRAISRNTERERERERRK